MYTPVCRKYLSILIVVSLQPIDQSENSTFQNMRPSTFSPYFSIFFKLKIRRYILFVYKKKNYKKFKLLGAQKGSELISENGVGKSFEFSSVCLIWSTTHILNSVKFVKKEGTFSEIVMYIVQKGFQQKTECHLLHSSQNWSWLAYRLHL